MVVERTPSNDNVREREGHEQLRKKRAAIFVPGLSETSPIFDVLTHSLREIETERGVESQKSQGAMQTARLYVVNTHDEAFSEFQHVESTQKAQEPISKDSSPILGIVSKGEKKHESFDDRVHLVEQAIYEALREEQTEELTIVGHSAGGAATLAAIATLVEDAKKEGWTLPKMRIILLAPAIPKEARKQIVVAPPFIRVIVRNVLSVPFSKSYVKQLFSGEDMDMADKDIVELFGPLKSEKFKKSIVDSKVPTAGGEGYALMMRPETLGSLTPSDWPKNLTVDVVIPANDRLVSPAGQRALVKNALKPQLTDRAKEFSVQGGHLAPLEDEDLAHFVAERIFTKRK